MDESSRKYRLFRHAPEAVPGGVVVSGMGAVENGNFSSHTEDVTIAVLPATSQNGVQEKSSIATRDQDLVASLPSIDFPMTATYLVSW
jgi:hypothetical protein